MKRRNYLSLILASLFFISLLTACAGEDKAPPAAEPSGETAAGEEPNDTKEGSLRLLLPDDAPTDALAEYVTLSLSSDMQERADALLNEEADIVSLSPQTAATLFRHGNEVQVLAVFSPGDPDMPDSMECLVVLRSWLSAHPDTVNTFLTNYSLAISMVDGAFLATGWDMMDLVQGDLEAQYMASPSPDRTVPDSSFFYLPDES